MRGGVMYTGATAAIALVVGLIGAWAGGAAGAVWAGVGIAFVSQVLVFWLLFVWLFPRRVLLAHGLGMLARLAIFAALAFLLLRTAGPAAAAALLALVAVFFVSTVLEPLFLQTDSSKRR